MSVYLLEAYYDENHKTGYEGSKPGDQIQKAKTGEIDSIGEVRQSNWRNMNATMLCRFKDRSLVSKFIDPFLFFVNSTHVGYSQPNRLSLKNYVKSIGYNNYAKLDKNKECDCSSLVCLCCNLAGISEVKDWNTDAMLVNFPKLTKYFDIYTSDKDPKYFNSSKYLMNGDILIRSGHTAGVYKDDEVVNPDDKDGNGKIDTLATPESGTSSIAGNYETTTDVNLRYGPSSKKYDVIKVLNANEFLVCEGMHTEDWYLVTTVDNISGYIKKDYIKFIDALVPKDEDGNGKIDTLVKPESRNSSLAGKYVATTDVNLRYGPSSKEYDVVRVIKKGEIVINDAFYTKGWLYVRSQLKGDKGYINKEYLKKKQ